MATSILEKELAAYEAAKPGLLPLALGKFVLIRDGQVVDTYDAEGRSQRWIPEIWQCAIPGEASYRGGVPDQHPQRYFGDITCR